MRSPESPTEKGARVEGAPPNVQRSPRFPSLPQLYPSRVQITAVEIVRVSVATPSFTPRPPRRRPRRFVSCADARVGACFIGEAPSIGALRALVPPEAGGATAHSANRGLIHRAEETETPAHLRRRFLVPIRLTGAGHEPVKTRADRTCEACYQLSAS